MSDLHDLQVRAAKRQSLFREVNERVHVLSSRAWERVPQINYICECADPDCATPLSLSGAEYESVRAQANRFLVAAEHLSPDVEVVVKKNERFWTVEKIEDARAAAEALDPRRRRGVG
jgi:hypothetical protein